MFESDAIEFFSKYMTELRHRASVVDRQFQGFLPLYWFRPFKIIVFIGDNGVVFDLTRPVGGKKDSLGIRRMNGLVEELVFPRFPENREATWIDFPKQSLHVVFRNVNFATYRYIRFFRLSENSDLRIFNAHFKVVPNFERYPLFKLFCWFFCKPSSFMTAVRAREEAKKDFWDGMSYAVAQNIGLLLSDKELPKETIRLVLESLQRLKSEYSTLITRGDLDEQALQQFVESHYYLIVPNRSVTKEKRNVGTFHPDLVLVDEEDTRLLVELQLNRDTIWNESASSGLTEARNQVNSWFDWLRQNESADLAKYSGLIIIGRRANYLRNKNEIDNFVSQQMIKTVLVTYDDVMDQIDSLLEYMNKKLENPKEMPSFVNSKYKTVLLNIERK